MARNKIVATYDYYTLHNSTVWGCTVYRFRVTCEAPSEWNTENKK